MTNTPSTAPTPPEEKGWWQKTKDWAKERPVVAGALGGSASGAVVGSVVPGLGTAIGAVVGGVGGAVSGAMSKHNK